MRIPHAVAQLPDWPEHEEAKLGSFIDGTTLNGAGAGGFG